MAEAKKMRESPEFQEKMKKFGDSGAFKEGIKKTKEIMDDPNQSAKLQAQMEHVSIKRVYKLFYDKMFDLTQIKCY